MYLVVLVLTICIFVVCIAIGINDIDIKPEKGANENQNTIDESKYSHISETPTNTFIIEAIPPQPINAELDAIFKNVLSAKGDRTLDLFPKKSGVRKSNISNKNKGTIYEYFVGKLYEDAGYKVIYNGVNKGSHDGGIDLICHSNNYTVLVQCKNYESSSLSVKDIYQFYGACRHYAIKNPSEIVSGAFFLSSRFNKYNETFAAIKELGISLYEGIKIDEKYKKTLEKYSNLGAMA